MDSRGRITGYRRLRRACVSLVLLGGLVTQARAESVPVTIGGPLAGPDRYAGKEVAFDGVLVRWSYFEVHDKVTTPPGRGQRIQLALADTSGAQVVVLGYVPSFDIPATSFLGRAGTAYSVRGTLYRIPLEPGPPIYFVVPLARDGLRRK